jgi:hypothetical protein
LNKRIFSLVLIVVLAVGIFSPMNKVAYGATIKAILSGDTSVTQGQTFTVTLKYTGTTFGSATALFDYNPSILQLVGSSDGPTSASGTFKQNFDSEVGSTQLTCTATFKAIGTGTSTISVTTQDIYDTSMNVLEPVGAAMKVSVKAPSSSSASSNANLSALKISGGTLSPAFSPSVTSYTVNVPNDVKVGTISATAQDSKATFSVTGSKNLSVGKNVRTVIVTAENGTTKTYTITINRSELTEAENTGNASSADGSSTVEAPENILVTVNDKEYIIQENYDEDSLPEGFSLVVVKYKDYEISAIRDSSSKFTLVSLKSQETGDEQWFFYNEETQEFSSTLSITADEAIDYGALIAKVADGEILEEADSTSGNYNQVLFIVLGGSLAVLIICVIALQITILKRRGR